MYKTMSYHFILSFEPFPALGPSAVLHGAVVRPVLRMYICMRATQYLSALHSANTDKLAVRTSKGIVFERVELYIRDART